MKEINMERLILRAFRETDYDDLFEYLSQLEDDDFEGYPGITYENGKEHLKYRIESGEFYAIELRESGKVIGNIYCGNRDYESKEVGLNREAHFRQNIWFHEDESGKPIWKDTYVYAVTEGDYEK